MDQKFRTYYMDDALFNLEEVISKAEKALADVDFDTLVGTGFSGGIVIPSLALKMGKKFVLVRKDDDDSHHGRGRLVGALGEKWIFVDDFVSSGRTLERVKSKVRDACRLNGMTTEQVGQYMYMGEKRFQGPFEDPWI